MSVETKKEDYMLFQNKLNKESITLMLSDYPNIAESEKLENHTKKTLAALLFMYENTKASESGKLYMDLQTVRRVAGVKMVNVKLAIHQLEQYGLIEYEKGERKGKASGFQINFEKLRKPLIINEGNELGNETDIRNPKNAYNNSEKQDNLLINKEGYPLHYTTLYNTLQYNTKQYNTILDKILINNLTNCLEMKFEKVIRESFEKQLLNTVRETVTSYLSENFEETVRKCLSELLHKQSEAQQSPVLFKDYEEPKREQTPYGRYNLSLRDFKKEQTEQRENHDIPACDNNKSGEAMPLQFNLVKQEPTPNGRASKLEEMREKYKEIEELAMRKLKQSLYHKNENGFQLLLRDTNYQLRSEFDGEHLKNAQALIEKKLRREMERLKTA